MNDPECIDDRNDDADADTESFHRAFTEARRAMPDECCERWYTLAGARVRVRAVGKNLAGHYDRALAHLALADRPSEPAHLTVDVWDEGATALAALPPAARVEEARSAPRQALRFTARGRIAQHALPNALARLDRHARHVVRWPVRGGPVSLAERTRPLAPLLSIWLYDRGIHVIHAGLVARGGRGVLFAGPGGAGKSTSTLACLCAGFQFLGDDLIALEEGPDGRFIGYSLFATLRLDAGHLERFPPLRASAIAADDPDEPKSLVLLAEAAPSRLAGRVPLRAIVLPVVAPLARSRLRPASPSEAVLRMAKSTLLQLRPSPGADGLRRLARLAQCLPAFWLELGRDLETIPAQVDTLLASLDR